jgi:beta-glucoside operon transcriptional antiterminator
VKVSKVFNNNVVLAVDQADDGAEVVLIGRGLGFGVRPGDDVDPARAEKTFRPGGQQTPERIAAFLDEIPAEDIELADEIVRRGRGRFGDYVGQHMLFPLADHLSFALRRAREGVTITYPLQWEVAALYPQEVAFSKEILTLVTERRGVRLPELEAIPFALHFVNARFGQDDISATMEMTEAFAAVLDTVRSELGIEIDEESLDATRFITHLRYLFLRQEKGSASTGVEQQQALYELVRVSQPTEFACAEAVRAMLEEHFGWRLDQNELLYLTLHIARLSAAAARSAAASAGRGPAAGASEPPTTQAATRQPTSTEPTTSDAPGKERS